MVAVPLKPFNVPNFSKYSAAFSFWLAALFIESASLVILFMFSSSESLGLKALLINLSPSFSVNCAPKTSLRFLWTTSETSSFAFNPDLLKNADRLSGKLPIIEPVPPSVFKMSTASLSCERPFCTSAKPPFKTNSPYSLEKALSMAF